MFLVLYPLEINKLSNFVAFLYLVACKSPTPTLPLSASLSAWVTTSLISTSVSLFCFVVFIHLLHFDSTYK